MSLLAGLYRNSSLFSLSVQYNTSISGDCFPKNLGDLVIRLVNDSGRTKSNSRRDFLRIRIGTAKFINTQSCCSEGTEYYSRYTNSKAERPRPSCTTSSHDPSIKHSGYWSSRGFLFAWVFFTARFSNPTTCQAWTQEETKPFNTLLVHFSLCSDPSFIFSPRNHVHPIQFLVFVCHVKRVLEYFHSLAR